MPCSYRKLPLHAHWHQNKCIPKAFLFSYLRVPVYFILDHFPGSSPTSKLTFYYLLRKTISLNWAIHCLFTYTIFSPAYVIFYVCIISFLPCLTCEDLSYPIRYSSQCKTSLENFYDPPQMKQVCVYVDKCSCKHQKMSFLFFNSNAILFIQPPVQLLYLTLYYSFSNSFYSCSSLSYKLFESKDCVLYNFVAIVWLHSRWEI